MLRFALVACLALAGCSSTHQTGDCSGSAPGCYQGWGGSPGCCLEGPSPATCVDGAWTCDRSSYFATECGIIDAICEGVDAGPLDGGSIPLDYFSCSLASECQLTLATCCDACARPTLDDVAAVNRSRQSDYYLDVACPMARTEPPNCPRCAAMPNPNLRATCQAGRCEEIDVESDAGLSGCTLDSDCVIRVPECCECGADTSVFNLIALAASAVPDYLDAICDPEQACDECVPTYPAEATARCVSGACRVIVGDP